MLMTSSVKGKDKSFVVALSFLKSTQILDFPIFFLKTTIIGDSWVASLTSLIKLVANNLSISCLKIVA
jgi:hypothetical protein